MRLLYRIRWMNIYRETWMSLALETACKMQRKTYLLSTGHSPMLHMLQHKAPWDQMHLLFAKHSMYHYLDRIFHLRRRILKGKTPLQRASLTTLTIITWKCFKPDAWLDQCPYTIPPDGLPLGVLLSSFGHVSFTVTCNLFWDTCCTSHLLEVKSMHPSFIWILTFYDIE